MATLEKLVKAFEALKVFQPGTEQPDDPQIPVSSSTTSNIKKKDQPLGKKEKSLNCNVVADSICASNLRSLADFPKFLGIAMETFLMLCDDKESDVRMVADECLNRTIKTLLDTNLGRLQVELYKEIKKNGPSRSLRAALWRFADMCHLIRPQKCRPYVVNLMPCIARICRRTEESVQETLAITMQRICPVLMGFTNDSEVKILLKAFLPNLRSNSACTRRTAASSLTLICQFTRKPMQFFSWLLNILLDMLIPVVTDQNVHVHVLLGVFLTLRHLIPHLVTADKADLSLKGSFGVMTDEQELKIGTVQFIQIYELLLHYSGHTDHNVVTASLETLQQLLRTPPPDLVKVLVTRGSIICTSIYPDDVRTNENRRLSQSSRVPSVGDDAGLDDDADRQSNKSGSGSTDRSSPVMADDVFGDAASESAADISENNADDELDSSEIIDLPGDEENRIIMSESTYSDIVIGEVREGLSASSSADTLTDKSSPSHQPKPQLRKGVSQDMINGNELETLDVATPASSQTSPTQTPIRDSSIGEFSDVHTIPVNYCVRLLTSRFLLTGFKLGLMPDRTVRVSVKALALGCVASAVSFYPKSFFQRLHVDIDDDSCQEVTDLLLYANHCDPQLKGLTALLLGNLIHAVMLESQGNYDIWLKSVNQVTTSSLTIHHIVNQLMSVIRDDSSVATRLGMTALHTCLPSILHSNHCEFGLSMVLSLLALKDNPYWLVKVELLELLSRLDFKVVFFLERKCSNLIKEDNHFVGVIGVQERTLEHVIMQLLGDDDARVRNAASQSIVKLVPKLFYPVHSPQYDPIIAIAKEQTEKYLDPVLEEWSQSPPALVHGLVEPFHFNPYSKFSSTIEANLSRVVSLIMKNLIRSTSKYMTFGCCRALCHLSQKYLTTRYSEAWCCLPMTATPVRERAPSNVSMRKYSTRSFIGNAPSVPSLTSGAMNTSINEQISCCGTGYLPMIISLLTSSSVSLDISSHQDILLLSGNLFSGAALRCLTPLDDSTKTNIDGDNHWVVLGDRTLVNVADKLLIHLIRVLNVCAHVVDEQSPGPPSSKPSLPSLPNPTLSPIKIKPKSKDDGSGKSKSSKHLAGEMKRPGRPVQKGKPEKDDKEDKKNKKDGIGTFYNHPHYMKLYDILKGAYSNYKISLDLQVGSSDKFGSFLATVLRVFSQLLEIGTLTEIGRHVEEILSYLKVTFTLESISTVLCVQQLLKSLFGTNLASQWDDQQMAVLTRKPIKPGHLSSNMKPGLYHSCFTTPYTQFTQSLAGCNIKTSVDQDDTGTLIGWLRKRAERKVPAILKPGSKTDKNSIASYIRLFEPLVIKALKQYTITSSLELQEQVLDLLAQLVQLRVNYCLLDSDQIFIGFVIKQFEYIEEGQIRNSDSLIPHIFHFLILLSYERYHSKTIIGMPKVIQLCDGIMASGQQPTTHAIPALQPIVHDLFIMRTNKIDAGKDLDTQREVVVSMLLRLIHYYQVLELVIIVLNQCHRESEDKWKRLSRQVTDVILPMLSKQQINIDSQLALDVLHRLFESVAPSVFRPVDVILKILFSDPYDLSCVNQLEKWLCMVLSILRVLISQSKEETVLSRLQELNLSVKLYSCTVDVHMGRRDQTDCQSQTQSDSSQQPEDLLARLLMQVIGAVSSELSRLCTCLLSGQAHSMFLRQQLSHLLLYMTHMFQSGQFRRVATATMRIIRQKTTCSFYSIEQINEYFLLLSEKYPTFTLQWCNILILLNYDKQEWWSRVMQTPQKYMMSSPSHSNPPAEPSKPGTLSCSQEVVRRGGLMLFCDYVCENLTDAEHMIWVIINHVGDLITQAYEPPVQDFISAIHRNSAASGLFIQAIHSRCENLGRPSMVKKTLQCLEAIHLSQSGTLLTLLIDKFLHTQHMAVARICDTIACRRVEMLLAEKVEDSNNQLPLEDIEKLLQFMKSNGLVIRHPRLSSLLTKMRNLLCPESKNTLSADKTHPLVLTQSSTNDIVLNREWFMSITKEQCFSSAPRPRECAMLLQRLDYNDIHQIITVKEFNLSILESCVALGVHKSLITINKSRDSATSFQQAVSIEQYMDPLLKATKLTMFRRINTHVNLIPNPHQVITYRDHISSRKLRYREKMEDVFCETSCEETLFHILSALVRYLISLSLLFSEAEIKPEPAKDIVRFSVLSLELVHWKLLHDQLVSSDRIQTSIQCLSLVLQNTQLSSLLSQPEYNTWVCSAINAVHQLLTSVLVIPTEKLVIINRQDSQDDQTDDSDYLLHACGQISELVQCLKVHLSTEGRHRENKIPQFMVSPLRNCIIGLARLPLVNCYARVPPLVWRMGWLPTPDPDSKTALPPLPLDYLQEKEVLREFIYRINTLGWVNRQQFEETWMCLLGVINPVHYGEEEIRLSVEEEIERTQCVVLAIRGITALLVQSTMTPNSGNPCNSLFEHRPRDKPLAFLYTRCGKKLAIIRGMVEREIYTLSRQRSDIITHHPYLQMGHASEKLKYLFDNNIDRDIGYEGFGLGQLSVESIWSLVGMLDVSFDEDDSVEGSPPSPTLMKERSSSISGLDIHSCLQFLMELYQQLLAPNANPKTPLMQLNEVLKSMLALSDLFTDRQQFEMILDTLLEVQRLHPLEDELSNQYLIVALCKAAAVVGTEQMTTDRIIKIIESALRSTHLPTRIGALYGSLYILEGGTSVSDINKSLVPHLTEYILKQLGSTTSIIGSQQHMMVLWSTAFYLVENFQDEFKDSDFTVRVLQYAISAASSSDENLPLCLYLALMRGLERLLLSDVLGIQDADTLIKLSVDRICLPSPQRMMSALGLLLTCMYSGKGNDQWSPVVLMSEPDYQNGNTKMIPDPESLIAAMERVTVLFDRIRKGFPHEAQVITRILPTFLTDFFPPQDIMNKVIGEFLSNQQPHPQLMAKVVFQVFNTLHSQRQHTLVRDWVMLSLSNFTQRTPISMAVWSFTCFFISSSTNQWLRALLPHIVERMGRLDAVDRRLFCLSALDFRGQLTDETQRRAFLQTFQTVALPDTPYSDLMDCLHNVRRDSIKQ
ncbi:huntingtin-like [Tubulanus polymorphus]|uniref:huntingtin-like n=1 Tax=Tubulanus polymorphus TaxID=672921 RepID=UPI003DA26267